MSQVHDARDDPLGERCSTHNSVPHEQRAGGRSCGSGSGSEEGPLLVAFFNRKAGNGNLNGARADWIQIIRQTGNTIKLIFVGPNITALRPQPITCSHTPLPFFTRTAGGLSPICIQEMRWHRGAAAPNTFPRESASVAAAASVTFARPIRSPWAASAPRTLRPSPSQRSTPGMAPSVPSSPGRWSPRSPARSSNGCAMSSGRLE